MGTPAHVDFLAFAARVERARQPSPERVLRAGVNLTNGALRIRRGADGIYGHVERPVTKPVEAVRAWLQSMQSEIAAGRFDRHAELREAVVAAGHEVDRAVDQVPAASRLREALLTDALDTIGGQGATSRLPDLLPWAIAAGLGGILVGTLWSNRKRRGRGRRR